MQNPLSLGLIYLYIDPLSTLQVTRWESVWLTTFRAQLPKTPFIRQWKLWTIVLWSCINSNKGILNNLHITGNLRIGIESKCCQIWHWTMGLPNYPGLIPMSCSRGQAPCLLWCIKSYHGCDILCNYCWWCHITIKFKTNSEKHMLKYLWPSLSLKCNQH